MTEEHAANFTIATLAALVASYGLLRGYFAVTDWSRRLGGVR